MPIKKSSGRRLLDDTPPNTRKLVATIAKQDKRIKQLEIAIINALFVTKMGGRAEYTLIKIAEILKRVLKK